MRGKTGFSSSFIPSKNNIVHGAIFLERTIINTWIQDDEMALILYTAVEKEKPKLLLSTQLLSHQASKLITQHTIFQLSNYGQDVVTGKDEFIILKINPLHNI